MRRGKETESGYLERAEKLEANLLALMETAEGLVYSLDRNFRYINLNSALKNKLKEVFGIDAKPGDKITGIIKKTDRQAIAEWKDIYNKAFKGEPVRFIKEFTHKGKTERWSFYISPIRHNGAVTGLVCYTRSVNEIERVRMALKSLRGTFPKGSVSKKASAGSIRPVLNLTAPQLENLESVFQFIFNDWKEQLTEKNVQIVIKVIELLFQFDAVFPNIQCGQKGKVFNPVIAQFSELISRSYRKHRDVSYYANALHLHPYYLNYLVKQHTGLTAKETIINHVIAEAKSLLVSSSLTIKEISFKMGFEYPEHFYSLFKKTVRVSPAQYRLVIR